jgi:hypothetical protein
VPLDKQLDHELFNFPILLSYFYPLFCIRWHRDTDPLIATEHFLIPPSNAFDEDYLVFAGVKLISNDDLVAVTFQCGFGFWDEECGFGLELYRSDI